MNRLVVRAGEVYDGRGLAANLALVLKPSGSGPGSSFARGQMPPPMRKQAIEKAGHEDLSLHQEALGSDQESLH